MTEANMWWKIVTGALVALVAVVGVAAVLGHRVVERSVEIEAKPAQVWQVLTDFASYAEWNPFLVHVAVIPGAMPESADRLVVGGQLDVTVRNHGSDTRFRPDVLAVERNRELRWRGRFLMPRLVDGEHYFLVEPTATGTRLTQGEVFRGALVPVAGSAIDVADGFDAMNVALRARVLATIAR